MKQLISLLFGALSLLILSCEKQVLKDAETQTTSCTCTNQPSAGSSQVRDLLTAHPWQINEVIDPFSGTRYKRGVISDGKNFTAARYLYKDSGILTGIDWFDNTIANTCYTLLDNRKIQVTSPPCTNIYNIITLSSSEFSYKDNSGTIMILGPVAEGETTGDK